MSLTSYRAAPPRVTGRRDIGHERAAVHPSSGSARRVTSAASDKQFGPGFPHTGCLDPEEKKSSSGLLLALVRLADELRLHERRRSSLVLLALVLLGLFLLLVAVLLAMGHLRPPA